jgi:hypothetical protein
LNIESVATAGPNRQKVREARMRPLKGMSPRRVRAGPGTRGLSGTDRKIQVATPSASTHRTQNTPRQPNAGSIAWTGDVVSALPSAPIAVAMPVT